MIAKTKKSVLSFQEDKIKVEYESGLIDGIYHFLQDIGAKNDIPADKTEAKNYVIRIHEQLAINNPIFPSEVEFSKIYNAWMADVIYGRSVRKGNNVSALVICLNDWIQLNSHLFHSKPESKPQQLPDRLENWDDDTIRNQLLTLKQIAGEDDTTETRPGKKSQSGRGWLMALYAIGGKGYTYRLSQEAKRRGIKV
jgi:hypothetical protein